MFRAKETYWTIVKKKKKEYLWERCWQPYPPPFRSPLLSGKAIAFCCPVLVAGLGATNVSVATINKFLWSVKLPTITWLCLLELTCLQVLADHIQNTLTGPWCWCVGWRSPYLSTSALCECLEIKVLPIKRWLPPNCGYSQSNN